MTPKQEYPFAFSVIMPVYNVAPYLREAVESIIAQDFGFERIQLILVDDGSTDESAEICEEYARRYPRNTLVIHKENGGQSSARNRGVREASGQYLNFCDPDDRMDPTVFSAVHRFYQAHGDETDIVAIPVMFFGDRSGEHPQNVKFRRGSRVIDLEREWNCCQMALNTAFLRADAAKELCFQEDLVMAAAEDAREVLKVLIHRPRLGVVRGGYYRYRKRGDSTLSASATKPLGYIPNLRDFAQWALDYARAHCGYVPKCVQFHVMYDLQWKAKAPRLPTAVIGKRDARAYAELLKSILKRIDDDVIMAQRHIFAEHKAWLLEQKHGKPLRLLRWGSTALLRMEDAAWFSLARTRLCLEFWHQRDGLCEIEGYATIYPVRLADAQVLLRVNGRDLPCEPVERNQQTLALGEPISCRRGFRAQIPLRRAEETCRIRVVLLLGSVEVVCENLTAGQYFPVSTVYESAYSVQDDWRLSMTRRELVIRSCGRRGRLRSELAFLRELWRKNREGGRKAVLARLACRLLRPFHRRPLWLISDRIMKAGDNGEAFFRFLREKHPEIDARYVISRSTESFRTLKAVGPTVDALSFRHKLLHLLADYNISAQADGITVCPFPGYQDGYRDLLRHVRFVFLQHGIIKDDLSGWLNRYSKDMAGFVTSTLPEYRSVLEGAYHYTEKEVWLTGLPRYDRLYDARERVITICPTWRRYLMGKADNRTGIWALGAQFLQSDYYRFYNALLNDPRLLAAAKEYGYRIQFFPHPTLQPHISVFQQNEQVTFLGLHTEYRDVYAQSDLMMTDYSSAVYDFAYLRKPVLYCQFDREQFFAGEHVYTRGYFDYERDGFGEVETDLDGTVARIIEYMEHGCVLKDRYRQRIDSFFAFHDQNNCQRVYDKIMALERERDQ